MCKRKLTIEQEYELCEKYENGSLVKDLMKAYGFKTKKSIFDIIERRGGKKRTFQETLAIKNPKRNISFARIDEPFKAYFVGLMMTDGWICGNSIGLSMTDKDVMYFVCEYFGKEPRIVIKEGNRKPQYRFMINSERIISELSRFGIVENKSRTLQPPRLKNSEVKYLSYIIRGIIDGDGWIRKDGKEFFICSMSLDFMTWCKDVLEKYYKLFSLNLIQGDKGIYNLRSSEDRNMFLLYAHFYYFEFGMSRKRNILVKRFREYNGGC